MGTKNKKTRKNLVSLYGTARELCSLGGKKHRRSLYSPESPLSDPALRSMDDVRREAAELIEQRIIAERRRIEQEERAAVITIFRQLINLYNYNSNLYGREREQEIERLLIMLPQSIRDEFARRIYPTDRLHYMRNYLSIEAAVHQQAHNDLRPRRGPNDIGP